MISWIWDVQHWNMDEKFVGHWVLKLNLQTSLLFIVSSTFSFEISIQFDVSKYKFLVLDFSFYSRKCTTNTKSSSTISIHWTASGIAFCWSITCSYCSWIRSCCAWTKSIKVRQTTKIGHKLIYRFTLGLRLRKLFCIF